MKYSAVILGLCFALTACAPMTRDAGSSSSSAALPLITLVGPASERLGVHVEFATTPEAQERGLMERKNLDPDAGMLFVFPDEQQMSFWMKNTLIPLDVVFFDASGHFVSVQTMDPCAADPCANYPSGNPAQYALEVPSGYAKAHGVGVGWVLQR